MENEPWLSGAVERVEREVQGLERRGIPREKIMIGGFSQGASVAAKYALTYPAKYWGLFILSGALPGMLKHVIDNLHCVEEPLDSNLQGTRVFVACGDSDPFIMLRAVDWTANIFSRAGSVVEKRVYEGLGHGINQDERDVLTGWVSEMIATA